MSYIWVWRWWSYYVGGFFQSGNFIRFNFSDIFLNYKIEFEFQIKLRIVFKFILKHFCTGNILAYMAQISKDGRNLEFMS